MLQPSNKEAVYASITATTYILAIMRPDILTAISPIITTNYSSFYNSHSVYTITAGQSSNIADFNANNNSSFGLDGYRTNNATSAPNADFRALKKVITDGSKPLPRINQTVEVLGGAKYFATINLLSGFSKFR